MTSKTPPDPEIAALVARIRASKDVKIKSVVPLSEDTNKLIVERVLGAETDAETDVHGAKESPEKPGARVVPFPSAKERTSKTRRTLWAGATALALAAGIFGLYVTTRGPGVPEIAYSLEISGDAVVRGDDHASDKPIRLRPSTRLRVRLLPKTPARDKALRVLVVRNGKAQSVTPAFTFAPDGAVVIDAGAHEALGDQPDGPAELVFVVGSRLPEDDEITRLAQDPAGHGEGGFDLLRRAVLFEGWGSTKRSNEPVEIEFAGCFAVTTGPACEVVPGTKLRIWAPKEAGKTALTIDGRAVESTQEIVQGGTRHTFDVAQNAKEILLLGETQNALLRLSVRPALDLPMVQEAFKWMQKNQLDEAEKKLQAAERDERPEAKLQALRKRARLERRRGNIDGSIASLRKAIEAGHTAGRTSDEMEDRQLLGYQEMLQRYDFAGAQRDFFEALPLESTCPECRIDGDYYRAIWAGEAGRLEEALRWLRRSQAAAERLVLPEQAAAAKSQLIETLSVLGRRAEVQALIDEFLKEAISSADPCVQTRFVTNAAWALFRGADAGDGAARAQKTAAEAVEIARKQCPAVLPNALVNLAFAELKAKNVTIARSVLDEAQKIASKEDARFRSWSEALAIEVELAEDPGKALSVATDLLERGEDAMAPELFFYASFTRARALDALGRTDQAIQAFEVGEVALDQWSARVPLGEGRNAFFTQQDQWSRASVDFYVRRAEAQKSDSPGKTEAIKTAADVARRSLARFFASLVKTETMPASELGALRKNQDSPSKAKSAESEAKTNLSEPLPSLSSAETLSLLYHPLSTGWVGFAIESSGAMTMKRLPRVPEDLVLSKNADSGHKELSAALLVPFADSIAKTQRLRLFGPTKLMRLPFEALPWKDGLLTDAVSVRYGFDAPAPTTKTTCNAAPRALVVTNPLGDLAGAESSGAGTRKTLAGLGFVVDGFEGATATREAVMTALQDPCTALFHYDGHARFEGRDGLRAALMLRDQALTVADLLSLPHVPQAIVLLGCATAKDEGLGLAQAFLQRGSLEVLATTEDVDDTLSFRIAERLYNGALMVAKGSPDLALALRTAMKSVRSSGSGADDPSRFRVLTR